MFADKSDEYGLSKEAYYFMGGLMKHISGIAAITNPLVNSYKRLTPGYGAPIYVAWSAKNRSPLIRIPLTGDGIMAIELRCPSDKTGYTTGDSGGCFKSRGYDSDGSRIM